MKKTVNPKARFWVEAEVALAKCAIFLAAADEEVRVNNYISASISAYYSIFHFSLCLMWLLPEKLPPTLHKLLIEIRDAGDELPNKIVSHAKIENFVCAGQLNLPIQGFSDLFLRARKLREFANYGPRVTYKGEQPSVGPCHFRASEINKLNEDIHSILPQILKAISPETAYKGHLGPIVIQQAVKMLGRTDLAFKQWSSESTLTSAKNILSKLIEVKKD